jgi:hypothetical protein
VRTGWAVSLGEPGRRWRRDGSPSLCSLPSLLTGAIVAASGLLPHEGRGRAAAHLSSHDAKVRAHVTLCVLALLLQRVLEGRLTAAGRPMTAAACFETLATCRLNRYEPNELLDCDYSITQAT